MGGERLSDEDVDRIAERVADVLEARGLAAGAPRRLVDANTLADMLSVTPDYVRENADALGGRRLGGGKRPRLRFDPAEVLAAPSAGKKSETVEAPLIAGKARRRPSRPPGTPLDLVPVVGLRSGTGSTQKSPGAAATARGQATASERRDGTEATALRARRRTPAQGSERAK